MQILFNKNKKGKMDKILEKFKKDLQNPINNKCIDCDIYNSNTRCSVNNGVFLCTNCANIHKKLLSSEISDIRIIPVIKSKKMIENDDRMKELTKKINTVPELTQDQKLNLINQTIIFEQGWLDDANMQMMANGGNFKLNVYLKKYGYIEPDSKLSFE